MLVTAFHRNQMKEGNHDEPRANDIAPAGGANGDAQTAGAGEGLHGTRLDDVHSVVAF